MQRYYTGVGARLTPSDIQDLMKKIGKFLGLQEFVVRPGGPPGADMAFEMGCGSYPKEIYLPFKNFQNNPSPHYLTDEKFEEITKHDVWKFVSDSLKKEEPSVNMKALPNETQRLYARDVLQIFGKDLNSPSEKVICWTPDNEKEGTRITLYIAKFAGVPVENLSDKSTFQQWSDKVKGI